MTVERLVPGSKDWNKYSFEHIQRYEFFSNYYAGKRVLDLACGVGYGTSIISQHAKSVTGVDISQEAINYAKSNFSSDNIAYQQLNYEDLPSNKTNYDLIVSFETIEHVKDPVNFLRVAKSLLVDNGAIICSTPNKARFSGMGYQNPYHFSELFIEEFQEIFTREFKLMKQFHQTETRQYQRLQELKHYITYLESTIHSSLWTRFERKIRNFLGKESPTRYDKIMSLDYLGPGDLEISPLSLPEPSHKTFILVGTKL